MSLYVCTRCGNVDNTAVAGGAVADAARLAGEPPLCTRCATGAWHGESPERPHDPATDGPVLAHQLISPVETPCAA